MQTNQVLRRLFSLVPKSVQEELAIPARGIYAAARRLGTGGKPTAIEIETDDGCTRACDYCPREDGEGRMESALVESIVEQLSAWKYNGRVSFHGYNEPLLDERLMNFIALTRREVPKANIMIFTNGDLLTNKKVKEMQDLGVYEVRISLHDPYSCAKEAKTRALAAKFPVATIMDLRAESRRGILFDRCGLVEIPSSRQMNRCYYADIMYIRSDGSVPVCCNDYKREVVLGNVHEESLRSIWEKPMYVQLRKAIRKGRSPLDLCQHCRISLP